MNGPLSNFYQMKQRCYNPKNQSYKSYGGRGLLICDEWLEHPERFIEWALSNGYEPGKHIHRKDNKDGYRPGNCEWLWPVDHRAEHMVDPQSRLMTINIGLPPHLIEEADKEAKARGLSRSGLILKALEYYLATLKSDKGRDREVT